MQCRGKWARCIEHVLQGVYATSPTNLNMRVRGGGGPGASLNELIYTLVFRVRHKSFVALIMTRSDQEDTTPGTL